MWTKVQQVIEYSQNLDEAYIEDLKSKWEINKKFFLDAVGGPIWESDEVITFPLDYEHLYRTLSDLIDRVGEYDYYMAHFLSQNREGVPENKVVCEYRFEDKLIPVGMKIGKALSRYWVDRVDLEVINDIQVRLSQIVQENKISGKLCLSVHPLDFLSSSENQHNWRSCHALDGEYRAGNLSYMTDSVTVMAYLKSEEDVELPRFPAYVPWNNKKWRCLLFFDNYNKLVWDGRQYPFSSDAILKATMSACQRFRYFDASVPERYYDGFWIDSNLCEWQDNIVKGGTVLRDDNSNRFYVQEPTVFWKGTARPLRSFIKDADNSLHFNDLLRSSFYTPKMYPYMHNNLKNVRAMVVGNETKCLCCGENYIEASEAMLCNDCLLSNSDYIDDEIVTTCAHCGERILVSEATGAYGNYYCNYCAGEVLVECVHCGQIFNRNNHDEGSWDPINGWECDNCR